MRESMGSRLVGRRQERGIDSVNDFECWASKEDSDDRNEWRGFVRGNAWSIA